jgi:hypothetical protein
MPQCHLTKEMYTQNKTKFKQTVCKVFANVMISQPFSANVISVSE